MFRSINNRSGKFAKTVGGNCNSSHLVYAAECVKHDQLCIGFTTRPLHMRFNNHRSDINTKDMSCELVKHFVNSNCNFDNDLKLYILQKNLPPDLNICKFYEDRWISRLDTRSPNGMNVLLNDYSQLYFKIFK